MIKSEELMLGNWVKDRGNKLLRIDWFERKKVCMKQSISGVEVHPMTECFDFIQPIELTEELLLKCGFVRKGDTSSNGSLLVLHHKEPMHPNGRIYYNSWCIKNEFPKHIHTLQNLYFFLTGKHLEIEL
jgi:hypothetical protein